jgi:hypothetical protein
MYGGMDAYLATLSISAVKEVMDKIEAAVVAQLQPGTSATDVSADLVGGIQGAVQALSGYGSVTLVGGATAWNVVRADTDVAARMVNTGVAPAGLDPRSISAAQLAAIFGASQVLEAVGPAASLWADDAITAIVQPDAALDPRSIPQLGRLVTFVWNTEQGVDEMAMETDYDTTRRSEVLDGVAYIDAQLFGNTAFASELTIAGS